MKKQWKIYSISFILPIFVLLIIYMVWGQYPFGDKTLLIWDMDEQYAPFFAQLHRILHGDASALYTFSRTLGGSMFSVAAYYLISPFNLVFYFFDAENIYAGILLVTVLKTGTCGISMYRFLNRRRQDMSAVIFSTAYALCSYMAAYEFNIFWIDALILLPFVCDGIEKIIDEQKYLLYTVSLALSIITNFYMGYMICLFSVLYFLCYFFFISDKTSFKGFLIYTGASLLGGALSMCVSLPVLDIMQGGKTGISLGILKNFRNMFTYGEFFDAFFCGTISDRQITAGKPLVYCGVFAVIMAVYWFICGREAIRKRLAYLLLLFVLTISFHHYNLNCVWHVFNRPTGSPYRFSFIYIFLLLYIAYKGCTDFADRASTNKYDKRVIFCIGIVICIGLLCRASAFMEGGKIDILLLNIFLIVVYINIILVIRNKTAVRLLLMLFTCAELFINAEYLYMNSSQYDSISVSEYQAYMQKMTPLVERMEESRIEDGGIVRTAIEKGTARVSNDPFLLGIYGLDSYTSVEKQNVMRIASNFGFSNNITWGVRYNNGSTKAGESFLGIKYIISGINSKLGYNMIEDSGDTALYINEYALPFAIFTEASIADIENPLDTFRYMNELYRSLDTEENEDVFIKLEGRLADSSNCEMLEDGGWRISQNTDEASSQPSYLEYEFEMDSEMRLYVRYDRAGASNTEFITEDKLYELDDINSDVKNLGTMPSGLQFKLRFYLPEEGVLSPDRIYVYGERADVLEAYAKDVNAKQIKVTMHNDNHINISCINEDDKAKYLLCTIPYDKGWKVKIDGKTTELLNVQDFAAVTVDSGVHEIELKFVPRGLYEGIGMTLVSVFALVLSLLVRKFNILNLLPKNGILK